MVMAEHVIERHEAFVTMLRRQARKAAAPMLLADRLDAWARSLPPARVDRGLIMAEITHALRVRAVMARAVLLDAGWRYRPGDDDVHPGCWFPPQ